MIKNKRGLGWVTTRTKEPLCLIEIDVKKQKQDKKKKKKVGEIQDKVLFFQLPHISHSPEVQSHSKIYAQHCKPL